MKRFAVRRLHLLNGNVLVNQVVEIMENGDISYYPLVEELPFTEWKGGDYYLGEIEDEKR